MIGKLNYKRLLLLAALPAFMLASCSKEEIGGTDDGSDRVPVTFTTAIQGIALPQGNNPADGTPGTRTAIDAATGETVWKDGDAVGIFMFPAGGNVKVDCLPEGNNKKYLVDPATGKLSPADGTPLYYPKDGEVDFIAYYPYDPTYDVSGGLLRLPYENQQDPAAIDALWAKVPARDRSSAAVAFQFAHVMCKVTLNVKAGAGVPADEIRALTGQDVKFESVRFSHVDMVSGEPHAATRLVSDVCLYKSPATTAGYNATFSAIISPHQSDLTVIFLVGGREYKCTLPDANGFPRGQHIVYPVTVRETGVEVGAPATDVPWTEGKLPTVTLGGKEFRLIRNADDLKRFADDVNKEKRDLNAIQTADIDLGGIENWVPINQGNIKSQLFTGIYNGNGYTISRLTIRSWTGDYTGLFGKIGNGALLTGIHLREVEITGQSGQWIGALAGNVLEGATVSLCSAQGKINVSSSLFLSAGGLVGGNLGAITRCRTDVAVTADATLAGQLSVYAGGITGENGKGGLLFVCHAKGSVTLTTRHEDTPASNYVSAGGIAGTNRGVLRSAADIYCCLAEGDVSAKCETDGINVYAGGLAGLLMQATIRSSYARGTAVVEGKEADVRAGAILGFQSPYDATISHCYGAGAGGKGTSNLNPDVSNIVYNTTPQSSDIINLLRLNNILVSNVPFTEYISNRTPAYGISITRHEVNTDNYWLPSHDTWPVPDFMRNN